MQISQEIASLQTPQLVRQLLHEPEPSEEPDLKAPCMEQFEQVLSARR
jgi:hypothetical protein